jgi:hypothetical protein
MTKYIVIVEFGKNENFGNDEGLFNGVCRDYVQNTISCKEEMLKRFGNHILVLSTTSYLIRSNDTEKELLETIKQIVKSSFDNEFYDFKHQVYVAPINGFEFATFREKRFEVEYINRD